HFLRADKEVDSPGRTPVHADLGDSAAFAEGADPGDPLAAERERHRGSGHRGPHGLAAAPPELGVRRVPITWALGDRRIGFLEAARLADRGRSVWRSAAVVGWGGRSAAVAG